MTAVVVVLLVVVLAGAAFAALWWRRVRRDTARAMHRDQRLITPPPSPYEPSQGFRLVDGQSQPAPMTRPTPPRPRLDAKEYVFGDTTAPGDEGLASVRHDSHWALERMTRHRRRKWRSRQWMRLGVVILLVVLAAGYALQRGHFAGTSTTSTSTTWPTSFAATSTDVHSAHVVVPTAHYTLKVSATATVDLVVKGHTDNYFHGTLLHGQSTTLTIDEPVTLTVNVLAVTVSLNGSPLNLPASATAPYALTITPSP